MEKLRRPPDRHVADYPDDLERLRRALEATGFTATDDDLAWAWGEYSETEWCAGWMSTGRMSDDRIVSKLRSYLIYE